MHETAEDLARLQQLLDRSHADAGHHLRSAFDQTRRLSAEGLAEQLSGIFELHLAVLSASGAPLVAPLDGIFYRGRVWVGIPAAALRARLVRRDPRVSASYNATGVALIVHGVAVEHRRDDPLVAGFSTLMKELYVAAYGARWLDWFEELRSRSPETAFTGYIEPRVMFAKGDA